MLRLVAVTATIAMLLACDEETPCDRFADYVCTCHEGEDDFDCDSLLQLAENPTQDAIDGCQVDLEQLKSEDETEGLVCEV